MRIKRFIVQGLCGAILLGTPILSYAQNDNASLIAELQAQIAALQQQITSLQLGSDGGGGSSTGSDGGIRGEDSISCPVLSRNLYLGSQGNDVTQLQQFLRELGYFTYSNNTGYFGPSTEQAVQAFQKSKGIVSYGEPETTGYGIVGPSTRSAIERACGESITSNSVTVRVPQLSAAVGDTVTIPVTISNLPASGFAGYDVVISYDPSVISISGIDTANTLSQNMTIASNGSGGNIFRISAALGQGTIVQSGTLFNIQAKAIAVGRSNIKLSSFQFNDGVPLASPIEGSVTVRGAGEDIFVPSPSLPPWSTQPIQSKSINLSAIPTNGKAPLAVAFTGTLNNFPSCGNIITWTWGDNTNESSSEYCYGTASTVVARMMYHSHVYQSPGTYFARLTVGGISSVEMMITVLPSTVSVSPTVEVNYNPLSQSQKNLLMGIRPLYRFNVAAQNGDIRISKVGFKITSPNGVVVNKYALYPFVDSNLSIPDPNFGGVANVGYCYSEVGGVVDIQIERNCNASADYLVIPNGETRWFQLEGSVVSLGTSLTPQLQVELVTINGEPANYKGGPVQEVLTGTNVSSQTKSISLSAVPNNGQPPLAATFTGTLNNFSNCGNTVTWTWGDNTSESLSEYCYTTSNVTASRMVTRSHVYQTPGTYIARLTVGGVPSNDIAIAVTSTVVQPPTITVSSVPIAQSVTAGTNQFAFANYVINTNSNLASMTSLPASLSTSGSSIGAPTNLSNCKLYEGSMLLTTGTNIVNPTAIGTNIFTLDSIFSVQAGVVRTITLKCDIRASTASGLSYAWGFADFPGQTMTVIQGGSFAAMIDSGTSGSLPYREIVAGTQNVELVRLKFFATGEDISLKRIALQLSDTAYNSVLDLVGQQVALWDGSIQIGSAVFDATTDTAISTLSNQPVISKDGSKIITVKGTIATISASGPLTAPGDILKVDYDGDAAGLNGTYGTGVSSGSTIIPSGGDTHSNGIKIISVATPTTQPKSVSLSATPSNGTAPLNATLTAQLSNFPSCGNIITWTWGDNTSESSSEYCYGTASTMSTRMVTKSHIYQQAGNYNAQINVGGTSSNIVQISAGISAPASASIVSFSASNPAATTDQSTTLSWQISQPADVVIEFNCSGGTGELYVQADNRAVDCSVGDLKSFTNQSAGSVSVLPRKNTTSFTANFTLRVLDSGGATRNLSLPFTQTTSVSQSPVPATTQPIVTVSYPNGGEQWKQGSNQIIYWSPGSAGPTVDSIGIDLMSASGSSPITNVTLIAANRGQYMWTIPSSVPLGQYRIRVCVLLPSGGNNCGNTDISDNAFTINAPSTSSANVAVTYPKGGETFGLSSSATITWQTTNISVAPYGKVTIGVRNVTTGVPYYVIRDTANDGSQSVSLAGIPAGTYQLFISSIAGNDVVYGWSGNITIGQVSSASSQNFTASALSAIQSALDAIQKIINQIR